MGANCCASSTTTNTEIAVPTIPPHESDPELINQVTKIQAVYRGHKVRKEYDNSKDGKDEEKNLKDEHAVNSKLKKLKEFFIFFKIS